MNEQAMQNLTKMRNSYLSEYFILHSILNVDKNEICNLIFDSKTTDFNMLDIHHYNHALENRC